MVSGERDFQAALLLAAVDGEDAMRGQRAKRLLVVLVHEEDLCIFGLLVERGRKLCTLQKLLAHLLAQGRSFHDGFGDDVHRACEGFFRRHDALFLVDEA